MLQRTKRGYTYLALACLALTSLAVPAQAREERPMAAHARSLESRVGSDVYEKAGLDKLTVAEQRILSLWLDRHTQEVIDITKKRYGITGEPKGQ